MERKFQNVPPTTLTLVTIPSRMFPELSLYVNGQESEYPFNVNAYESEYSKFDESGNINESGKISSSVNVVLIVNVRKSYGHDMVPPRLVKESAAVISKLITHYDRLLATQLG